MDFQAIIPFSAERRDQRGVDIDDPLRESGSKVFTENGHEACQNNQFNAIFFQDFFDLFFISQLGIEFLSDNHNGRNVVFRRSCQGISLMVAGKYQGDFAALQDAAFLGINQCLQIGAAAGNKNCDFCFQHITTPSSEGMISPMM